MNVSERFRVPDGLEKLVRAIREDHIDLNSETDMKKGARIRDVMIAAVKDMASSTAGFPRLLAEEEFVGGSFGRRTQAQPLDDIDLFFPLDAAALRMESPSSSPTRETLVSRSDENALGCVSTLHDGNWLDSIRVLDHIEDRATALPLAVAAPSKNSRGRCLQTTYEGINVDLVFVLMGEMPGHEIDRYHLPTGDSRCWKATNPKEDREQLSAANQNHNGLLLPTIRALKAWNDHALGGRLKSVHLEVMASHYLFTKVTIDNVVAALILAFHDLPDLLAGPCPDPTNLGEKLDVNLHEDDRLYARTAAGDAAVEAVHLNEIAATDPEQAARGWSRLLLADGPKAPERDRPRRPPRHDADFGQPASRCDDPNRYKQFGVAVPRREDLPTRAPDQSGRDAEYA